MLGTRGTETRVGTTKVRDGKEARRARRARRAHRRETWRWWWRKGSACGCTSVADFGLDVHAGGETYLGKVRNAGLRWREIDISWHTARTGQWGQSLSDTFLFISKISNQMIIADSLVCTNRSHDLVWVTNGTPKFLFRAAGARTLGLN